MAGKVGMRSDLPTTLPARYTRGFPWVLDKRCQVAREFAAGLWCLWQDLGGVENLSVQQRILCERVVYLRHRVLAYETAVMKGETPAMDAGTYSNHCNVLLGHLKALGLGREAKPAQALRTVMGSAA